MALRLERGPDRLTLHADGLPELPPERCAEPAAAAVMLRGTFSTAPPGGARLVLPLGSGWIGEAADDGRPAGCDGHGGGAPEEKGGPRCR